MLWLRIVIYIYVCIRSKQTSSAPLARKIETRTILTIRGTEGIMEGSVSKDTVRWSKRQRSDGIGILCETTCQVRPVRPQVEV